jgi:hypothetical protein
MKPVRWFLVLAVGTLVAGCFALGSRSLPDPVDRALHHRTARNVTLYSLEPRSTGGIAKPDAKTFHGHIILGETTVDNPATRKKLFAAFRKGVADHDGSVAACFLPHHGLRIESDRGTLDLVICFQCAQVKAYENGVPSEALLISTSPRATFDELLAAAGLPLSKGANPTP